MASARGLSKIRFTGASHPSSGIHAMPSAIKIIGRCGERPTAGRANHVKRWEQAMVQVLPGLRTFKWEQATKTVCLFVGCKNENTDRKKRRNIRNDF